MLGRVRRTSRTDVGLALAFVGLAYLVWALVAGISRDIVQDMIKAVTIEQGHVPSNARLVENIFVNAGFVIDVVGVVWLVASLVLVVSASRQRISISWAWATAMAQTFIAAIGSVMVGRVAQSVHPLPGGDAAQNIWSQVSGVSLAVSLVGGVVVWVTFLIWLLVERARYDRRGPTMTDGMRSNVYR
jgi:hypothetical protein